MNSMRCDFFSKSLAAASLLVALCSGCSTVVEHPEFARRRAGIRHIAVVTPNVEFCCEATKSRRALPDKETELRTNLMVAITRELVGKGYEVQFPEWKSPIGATDINSEFLAVQEAINRAEARTNFYTLFRQRRPRDAAVSRQREDMQLLATASAADTIAFVQLNGYTNTLDRQAIVVVGNFLSFLGGVASVAAGVPCGGHFDPLHGMVNVQFMLVEGVTGEPLWANFARSTDEHPKLDQIVKELIEPLPGRFGLE
jgi:hypothetical protein